MKNLWFALLVVCTPLFGGCAVFEYADYAVGNYGTIHGHEVYHRTTIVMNGEPRHVSFVRVRDYVDERDRSIVVLRAYYLPKKSPGYVKIYEVPRDRSRSFRADTMEKLREIIEAEEGSSEHIEVDIESTESKPSPVPLSRTSREETNKQLLQEIQSLYGSK